MKNMLQIKLTQRKSSKAILVSKTNIKAKNNNNNQDSLHNDVSFILKEHLIFPNIYLPNNTVPMTDKPVIHQMLDNSWTIFSSLLYVK